MTPRTYHLTQSAVQAAIDAFAVAAKNDVREYFNSVLVEAFVDPDGSDGATQNVVAADGCAMAVYGGHYMEGRGWQEKHDFLLTREALPVLKDAAKQKRAVHLTPDQHGFTLTVGDSKILASLHVSQPDTLEYPAWRRVVRGFQTVPDSGITMAMDWELVARAAKFLEPDHRANRCCRFLKSAFVGSQGPNFAALVGHNAQNRRWVIVMPVRV